MIDYKEIGKRIAVRRKELKLKQHQVCEMVDVNYKYLSNIETGRSAPSLELIMKLCEVLRTTPDYILSGTEINENGIPDEQLVGKISRLDKKKREMVDGFIDLLNKIE